MDILDSNTHQNLIPTRSAGADIVLSEADAIRATACRPRIGRLESAHHARNRGLKDIALCSIMWDAMLRRSEAAGLGAGYSGHSPRVGAVQALAAANISLAAIMEHGRWQSSFSEWKAQAEEMPYKTLFRYAEENTGKLVYYEGNVVQVIEGRGGIQLRVNVTPGGFGFWTDTVYLRYADPPVRVLEGDLIEFIGRMNGTITYESILGADITIPDITVLSLTINSE